MDLGINVMALIGLEDANFSNQSEILTQLLDNQLFKLDDNN